MITIAAAAAATAFSGLAIVAQDQTALRAAPSGTAAQQAMLWQGDLLEVRGEKLDHVQVYDHRRERAGYVHAAQLRRIDVQEAQAPQLLSVLRFVRDTPGAEALGIAYVAAYLKAVPANAITAEPFDALGTMAERLARRASTRQGAGSAAVAAHLEGVAQYGVKFFNYEREGAIQLCYDGEAFRRVLQTASAQADERARAVLALTRHDCIDPNLRPHELAPLNIARTSLLDGLPATQFSQLTEPLKNRLRLRRAAVWSTVAFESSRATSSAPGTAAAVAAQRALAELAAVNKTELADDDVAEYADAAVRVGASRWAALPTVPSAAPSAKQVRVLTQAGEPGQTCVLLTDHQHDAQNPLARRCTFGVVWAASARVSADGRTVALAVQPLATWTELWIFRAQPAQAAQAAQAQVWDISVMPPAASEPGLGYVEFAGFVPGVVQGPPKMLLAREARVDGRIKRSFEVLNLESLATEKYASTPQLLVLFGKWQDALWKSQTISLR
jgi:hypothetical protein